MPHISVTIPVFNRAHLVGRTIESVLKQSFSDFEILVVDDASQDNTVEVIRQYAEQDSRIRLVINPKNLGLTRNWNKCLELADGPLVQVMQSDDLIDADYLQMVSDVFEQQPSVGIVAASCRYIDSEDQVFHPGTGVPDQLFRAGDEAALAFLSGGYPHFSSVVFRRVCYEKLGGFDEKIWHGPDMELDVRIAAHYDYYRFGGVHTSFRRHGSNMGNLEYLRNDFLEVDWFKRQKTLEYLSVAGRRQLGIVDLDAYLKKTAAQVALAGVVSTIMYDRPSLSRFYLRQALRYDPRVWQTKSFWKGVLLNIWPALGRVVMQRRVGVGSTDRLVASNVEQSLQGLDQPDSAGGL
jgi:glycosyltransferase involved in cell wall biosynthesis